MVLAEYKPTRSQLLQLRRTRRTAERGHRLLKLKRDALIVEFFRVLERAKTLRSHLADKYRVAEQRLAIARAIEGSIGVRSAALASKEVPTLQLKTKNVMGIIVPKIDAKSVRKKLEERGYGIVTIRGPRRGHRRGGGNRNDDAPAHRGDREGEATRERPRVSRDPGAQVDRGVHPAAARGDGAGQLHAPEAVQGDVMERLAAAWEDPARRAMILRRLWLVSTGFTIFGFAVMLYLIWASR